MEELAQDKRLHMKEFFNLWIDNKWLVDPFSHLHIQHQGTKILW